MTCQQHLFMTTACERLSRQERVSIVEVERMGEKQCRLDGLVPSGQKAAPWTPRATGKGGD